MGVAVFLFTKLLLQRQKSMYNFRQMSLSSRLMACMRKASDTSRSFSLQRSQLQSQWDNISKCYMQSNQHQAGLTSGMASGSVSIFNTQNLTNTYEYQQYQAALEQLKQEEEDARRIAKLEEDEINHDLETVKAQVQMVDAQLKAIDEGLNSSIKDSAPKYC